MSKPIFQRAVFGGTGVNIYSGKKHSRAVFGGEGITLEESQKRRAAKLAAKKRPDSPDTPPQNVEPTKAQLRDQIRAKAKAAGVAIDEQKEKWLNSNNTNKEALVEYLANNDNFQKKSAENSTGHKGDDHGQSGQNDEKDKGDENKGTDEMTQRADLMARISKVEGNPSDDRIAELNALSLEELGETAEKLESAE